MKLIDVKYQSWSKYLTRKQQPRPKEMKDEEDIKNVRGYEERD